jgi:hypothetical protein
MRTPRQAIFFGSDAGEEEVREIRMPQHFARSMSLADAMSPDNLLCYEMNGPPLPQPNGFPVRLIGSLHGARLRDIREDRLDGETAWMESSVGRALLESVPAKVTRRNGRYRIVGAAWGASIARAEVQIDGGPWMPATLDRSEQAEFAWTLWSLDWTDASPGEPASPDELLLLLGAFLRLGRAQRGDGESVDVGSHQVAERRIDHALTVDRAPAGERLGDDGQAKMRLALRAGAGMPGVPGRFVHQLKPRGAQRRVEAAPDPSGDLHRRPRRIDQSTSREGSFTRPSLSHMGVKLTTPKTTKGRMRRGAFSLYDLERCCL